MCRDQVSLREHMPTLPARMQYQHDLWHMAADSCKVTLSDRPACVTTCIGR